MTVGAPQPGEANLSLALAEDLSPDQIRYANLHNCNGETLSENPVLCKAMTQLEIAISRTTDDATTADALHSSRSILGSIRGPDTTFGRRAQLAFDSWPVYKARAYDEEINGALCAKMYGKIGAAAFRFSDYRRPFDDLIPGEMYESFLLGFLCRAGIPACPASPREECHSVATANYNHDIVALRDCKVGIQCKGNKSNTDYQPEILTVYMQRVLKTAAFDVLGTTELGHGERSLSPQTRHWLFRWTGHLLAEDGAGRPIGKEAAAYLDDVTAAVEKKVKTKARHLQNPKPF